MGDDPKPAADKKPEGAAPREEAKEKPGTASPQEGEVDYKELLHLERDRSERAENERDSYRKGVSRLERENRRLRRGAPDPEDEPEDEAEDKPITRRDIQEIIGVNKVDSILDSMIKDPNKRAYVKELYDNRIRRTGTSEAAIREDIETAIAIADSKRVSKENDELKRMNNNRSVYVPPADGGGGGGGGGPITRKAHEWTPEQESALERRAQAIGLFGEAAEKYKEQAWREFQSDTAFKVKPQPRK